MAVAPAETAAAASLSKPSRLASADALRAVATVLVVVIHTSHWPSPYWLYGHLDLISRVSVPAFMVLTGVLLGYRNSGEPMDRRAFLRRRFSRTLLPWLVWAPVYAVTGWYLTNDIYKSGGFAQWFSYGAGHLWFLLLIPQMYLLYLLWPRTRLWRWAVVAMAVQLTLFVYRLYGPMPSNLISGATLWHGFQIFPFWIGYFAVGVAAGHTLRRLGEPQRLRWPLLLAALLATLVAGWLVINLTYGNSPYPDFQGGTGAFLLPQQPIYALSLCALVLTAAPLLRGRAVRWVVTPLSDNSLGVYILHPLLIYLIAEQYLPYLFTTFPRSMIGLLIITVGGLVTSLLASMLLSLTPLAVTLGVPRRHLRLAGTSRRDHTRSAR